MAISSRGGDWCSSCRAWGWPAAAVGACRSGQAQDSAVLTAMDVPPNWRQSLLRFSLGPWLTNDDLELVPRLLSQAIEACT